MSEDICRLIQSIAAHPEAIVSGLTIRDYLEMREHVRECEKCHDSVEEVIKNSPPDEPTIGFNVN